ncbi:MAG TPA: arsenic resistance N-acetyltransferase ArsN2 [Gemmatimonadaceae bacterium]|jgi:N-acetylglutamate synthase and related acetyltransferases
MTASTPILETDPATPALRAASAEDLPAVERLLAGADLPVDGVAEIFATRASDFVVAEDPEHPGMLVAAAGLEICGDNALLRSVAVRRDWQSRGLGHELVRRIVCVAEARDVGALYLLTTTAEHYFPRFGFTKIDRDAVPQEIRDTLEFRSACPESAVAMARPLHARPG